MFRPINDICIDCGKTVRKNERQDTAFDKDNRCRRVCGTCLAKEPKKEKSA